LAGLSASLKERTGTGSCPWEDPGQSVALTHGDHGNMGDLRQRRWFTL